MKKLRYCLKVFNPIIWIMNYFKYQAHVDAQRGRKYKRYEFSNDTKYF